MMFSRLHVRVAPASLYATGCDRMVDRFEKPSMSILKEVIRDVLAGARRTREVARSKADNPIVDYLERNPDGRMVNKWRHYFDIYHRHLAKFRGRRLTLLEIGVFNGGSLPMWRDYLGPQARIVGVDIAPECEKFAEPGIDVVIGDQSDRAFLRSLFDRYPDIAIIIDDGGHRMHQQIATFEELYSRLPADGVYLCEDTHTSYMSLFGGGYQQPQTFIERIKPLIDSLHAFHSADPQFAASEFTRTTDSIHFYDSLVVIERRVRVKPEDVTYGTKVGVRYVGPSLSGKL